MPLCILQHPFQIILSIQKEVFSEAAQKSMQRGKADLAAI